MMTVEDGKIIIYPSSSIIGSIIKEKDGKRPTEFYLKITKSNISHIFKSIEAKEQFFMWLEKAVYNALGDSND